MDTIAEQKRRASYVNLDPAAEDFTWEPTIGKVPDVVSAKADIRELISLEDAMEELNLGPNGGLVYCFEYCDWVPDLIEGTSSTISTGWMNNLGLTIMTTSS